VNGRQSALTLGLIETQNLLAQWHGTRGVSGVEVQDGHCGQHSACQRRRHLVLPHQGVGLLQPFGGLCVPVDQSCRAARVVQCPDLAR